jgi:cysteine/O-acetylserine efflux protein
MPNFVPFITYLLVTTFTPGPNNILSMTNGMRSGYRKTLPFLGGITSGFFVVMLISGLLNFVLISLVPQVKFWLNILGAAYMLYLAWHVITSRPPEASDGKDNLNTFGAGFLLQFVNVKGILYGVTIFSSFIVPYFQNPLTVSLFAPLLALVGFIAISCWALGGDLFSKLISKNYRLFNWVMGGLLIYTAVASLIH